jgi:hypothetical protein
VTDAIPSTTTITTITTTTTTTRIHRDDTRAAWLTHLRLAVRLRLNLRDNELARGPVVSDGLTACTSSHNGTILGQQTQRGTQGKG